MVLNSDNDLPLCCQHCKKTCRLLQCARCRSVFYCSRECQKQDWKAGHRKQCRAMEAANMSTASAAWHELQDFLRGLSLSKADENFHKATREVERLKQEEKMSSKNGRSCGVELLSSIVGSNSNDNNEKCDNDRLFREDNLHTTTLDDLNPTQRHILSKQATLQNKTLCWKQPQVDYVVEEMSFLMCYQIRLTSPLQPDFPKTEELETFTERFDELGNVLILNRKGSLDDIYLGLQLDRISEQSNATTIRIDSDGHMNIRIPTLSHQNDFSVPSSQPLTTSTAVNTLQCRLCGHLLIKSKSITSTLPLPTGNWDEITDFLSCYNGVSQI